MKPDCFSWYIECPRGSTKEERMKTCPYVIACFEDWYKSGGRCGGYYDSHREEYK